MTTYKEIFGKQIKQLSTDPANDAEGQIWFNTTSGAFKTVVASGAWSSGSNLVGAVRSAVGSSGTQTASLSVGGESPGYINLVEEYNGSGWTTATNYPLSIQGPLVAGTQTAAVVCGGNTYPPSTDRTETFEYDGSSWTASGALPAGRRALNNTGFGSQTAAVQSGGLIPGGVQNTSNEYNGSIWTAGNTINTNRYVHAGAGTLTAGIISGGVGVAPSYTSLTNVEEYDGTTFTAVNSMSVGRGATAGSNQAPQTSLIVFGGNSTPGSSINSTESYDGTNWTTQSNMALARQQLGGSGSSSSSGLAFAGYSTTQVTATEEYNFSATATTGAVWASSGNINTSRYGLRGTGTQTAMVAAGGNIPPNSNTAATEEYNGFSWTSVTSLPAVIQDGNMTGTETASIYAGGTANSSPYPGNTNAYNGSSWTSGGNMNTDVAQYGLTGTSTAAVAFGGYIGSGPGRSDAVQNYNGTSWSSNPTSLPALRGLFRTAGTQTATFMAGGNAPPGPQPVTTLSYDGSSFSAEADSIVGFNDCGAWGTANSAYYMGGDQPTGTGGTGPKSSGNFYYNGTSWATSASITSGGGTFAWAKSSNQNGLIAGGTPGHGNRTEEFQPETTAANVKTLTSS